MGSCSAKMVNALSYEVRSEELTVGDLEQIMVIEQECNRPTWSPDVFLKEFENSYSRIFGLRNETRVVGFLVAHLVLDEGHIVNFGVLRSMRGRGLGRCLLEESLEALRMSGVRTVTLEVRQGNLIAQSLYRSLGFEAVGLRRAYYSDDGEDAVIMSTGLGSVFELQEIADMQELTVK